MSNLVFRWSKVSDGNMSFKYGEKDSVIKNKEKFLGEQGVVTLSLSGGTEITEVTKVDIGKMVEADAAITNEAGVGLFMCVGDCFPVAILDSVKNKLALVHCGRSGIEGKIVKRVIERLSDQGVDTNDLVVKIGPGIRKESYKFPEQDLEGRTFPEEWKYKDREGWTHLDLIGYLMKQLDENGVKPKNIEDCGIDTCTDNNYFSHYRDRGQSEGRFGVVAMIK